MKSKGVVIPVILILLAGVCWWAVLSRWRSLERSLETTQVLTARVDLPAGTALKEDLLEVRMIPRTYMQQDAYEVLSMSDIKLVNGLAAAVRIPKGNQVTQSCLVSSGVKMAATDSMSPAQQHYLAGLKYFQGSDYQKAREEWKTAKKLDASNPDAAAGLKRIDEILAAGK